MSQPRTFMDEGISECSAICSGTQNKFRLRMIDRFQGRIEIYGSGSDSPIDAWILSREEMQTLFRVLSKPYVKK